MMMPWILTQNGFAHRSFIGRPALLLAAVTLVAILIKGQSAGTSVMDKEVERVLNGLWHRIKVERLRLLQKNPRVRYVDQGDDLLELSNEWVAEIHGGSEKANIVATSAGFKFVAEMRGFPNMYLLEQSREETPKISLDALRNKREINKPLKDYEGVQWVERQRIRRRVKRDTMRDTNEMFNDPLWSKQWSLHDTRSKPTLPKLDLHVIGAWKLGYTGKGVVVSILDDGIQHNHSDLQQNYDPLASYDLNDNDDNPMPTFDKFNRHGTRCAGEVAMTANNNVCGVGVAYDAKIGGIRMLDGKVTDRLEAEALKFHINHIDVFSASWGPTDDGRTVEGPGLLAERAILDGILEGRNGKGTIYVWASGNGGHYEDDCNCDGYTDSIYTLSVSSASQHGVFPWYGEKCASTLATTYSSGMYDDQKIVTVDLVNNCTTEHTGTSASAPLAAGIVALGLQANSKLTWRDVQHITTWTSEPEPLLHNNGWLRNGRGLYVNNRFGFGLMNAESFVKASRDWKNVPPQVVCTTTFPLFKTRVFAANRPEIVRFSTDACENKSSHVNYLEHLQLVADIAYTRRGNLAIYLRSPAGTRTQLLSPRSHDNSNAGFHRWPFMSVHTWGENPAGSWQLEIEDTTSVSAADKGALANLTLILYGTKSMPHHYQKPRDFDMNYSRVHDRAIRQKRIDTLKRDADETAVKILNWKRKRSNRRLSESEVSNQLTRINRALRLFQELKELEQLNSPSEKATPSTAAEEYTEAK